MVFQSILLYYPVCCTFVFSAMLSTITVKNDTLFREVLQSTTMRDDIPTALTTKLILCYKNADLSAAGGNKYRGVFVLCSRPTVCSKSASSQLYQPPVMATEQARVFLIIIRSSVMNETPYIGNEPGIGMATVLIMAIVGIIIVVVPFWRIFEKAGLSGWWSIGMTIPVFNVALLYFLAFTEWPVRRGINRTMEPPPATSHRPVPPNTTV